MSDFSPYILDLQEAARKVPAPQKPPVKLPLKALPVDVAWLLVVVVWSALIYAMAVAT